MPIKPNTVNMIHEEHGTCHANEDQTEAMQEAGWLIADPDQGEESPKHLLKDFIDHPRILKELREVAGCETVEDVLACDQEKLIACWGINNEKIEAFLAKLKADIA